MALIETPPLLMLGTKQEYIDRLRTEYNHQRIKLPEGKEVLFFLDRDIDCEHAFCGKNSTAFNPFRAQRLLWVRFLLETNAVRTVKRSLKNGCLVFYCEELGYMVVCSILPRGDLKFVTQYVADKEKKRHFNDPLKYTTYTF